MARALPDRDRLIRKAEKAVSQLDAKSFKNKELHRRLADVSVDAQARSDGLKLSGYDHWQVLARHAERLEVTLTKYKSGGTNTPKPDHNLYAEVDAFKTAVVDASRAPE